MATGIACRTQNSVALNEKHTAFLIVDQSNCIESCGGKICVRGVAGAFVSSKHPLPWISGCSVGGRAFSALIADARSKDKDMSLTYCMTDGRIVKIS